MPEGAGYNDNGTGSAAILEVAEEMARVQPQNKVRFAWWGRGARPGRVDALRRLADRGAARGHRAVPQLRHGRFPELHPRRLRRWRLRLRPGGSFRIRRDRGDVQQDFTDEGLPFQGTAFTGRSDYQAFISNGIPAGGLFTGADGVKTEAEEARYGGVAGSTYDPCYHQTCDSSAPIADGGEPVVYAELYEENDLDGNLAPEALDTNADAIAHAAITYAYDTSPVNGEARASTAPHGSGAHPGEAHLHGVVRR